MRLNCGPSWTSFGISRIKTRVAMPAILMLAIYVLALTRIFSCHGIYSPVIDEPPTLAAGIEFLDTGHYTLETLHPPLARVLSALGPYANGLRFRGGDSIWDAGAKVYHSELPRQKTAALARLGNLLPFTVAALIVGLWAYRCQGKWASIAAVYLFTTLPPILGHSSIATLDICCAAFTAAALFSLQTWFENASPTNSVFLGLATGLAVLSKFSTIGFIGAAFSFFLVLNMASWIWNYPRRFTEYLRAWGIVALACGITIWAGYNFSFHPLKPLDFRSQRCLEGIFGPRGDASVLPWSLVESIPIPAPEFVDGVLQVQSRDQEGHLNVMCGELRTHGWLHYYPLRLLLKSPVAFLSFAVAGAFFILRDRRDKLAKSKIGFYALLGAIAILDVGMQSSINNGLRQLLAIYPLLSVMAGIGCGRLWNVCGRSRAGAILTIALLGWQTVSTIRAYPDYLSYFNECAGSRPERFAADSDIDWAQDLDLMAARLKYLGADDVGIAVRTGDIGLEEFGLPVWHHLEPNSPKQGWFAVSVHPLIFAEAENPDNQYAWLRRYQPIERVGNSILIYHIDKESSSKEP